MLSTLLAPFWELMFHFRLQFDWAVQLAPLVLPCRVAARCNNAIAGLAEVFFVVRDHVGGTAGGFAL